MSQIHRVAIFAALAAVGAVAIARTRGASSGQEQAAGSGAVDVPAGDDAQSDSVAADAAAQVADVGDALGGLVMQQQTLSSEGLAALQRREGFSAVPYRDASGYSIGYGHFIKDGESFTTITEDEGAQLLAQDVAWAESAVRASVAVPITQGQFDALVSFAYNVGAGAFRSSTLVRTLNAGNYDGAASQFERWNISSGQVNQALVARRADEQAQFTQG